MIEHPRRFFKLKSSRGATAASWLNRHTIYEGRLISMTARIVRLSAPGTDEPRPYVDISYDWVIPVR